MPARDQWRPPASSPFIIHEYASSESSASLRNLSSLVSGAGLIVIPSASPTTDQNISDAALFFPDDSMHRVAGDPKQLDYPPRPMTPGEK